MAEKKYIEREAFIESQQHLYCENCARRKNGKGKFVYDIGDAPCRACGIMDVLDDVEDFPAADVRPVVLCKDCKRYGGRPWENNETGTCGRTDFGVSKDDFCSYGVKREKR